MPWVPTILAEYLRLLYRQLLRVQNNLGCGAGDFCIDLDQAFVCPGATELQVEERDVVIDGLGPGCRSQVRTNYARGVDGWVTHTSGSVSLSEAMVRASAEQCLMGGLN